MRLCLLCPGPGPRLSSPSWARLAMLMWRADLRKIGQTDSRWGAEAQKHLGEGGQDLLDDGHPQNQPLISMSSTWYRTRWR